MENELEKLRKEIGEKRDALDFTMNNNSSVEDVLKVSQELDDIIAKYLKSSEKSDEQNKKLLGKYTDIIETNYKDEIIDMIRDELKNISINMQDEELNHFCNNVYIFSVLRANNVKDEEILKQIMYRNDLFQYEMQQKGIEIKPNNPKVAEDYYIKLVDKYKKIIEERM